MSASDLTSLQPLGPVRVLCEYEFTPGEREEGPESRHAGPGHAASVIVTRVYIVGAGFIGDWVDAELFDADWVARTEEAILQEHQDD